ncbi:MAG: CoA-binding protein, partial [Acidimicrobiia bacterium]
MSAFFTPGAVAVVGASPREASGGHKIFRNLVRLLDVPVYPIHPTAPDVLGHPCFKSIGDAPTGIELAVVFVPSPQIPEIVEDCISAGVKAVCVEAGGFADAGEDGTGLQQRLAALAESSGTRIWGPNCAGYVSSDPRISTAFVDVPDSLAAGTTSLVFQSGMAAAALLAEIASRRIMPIDKACSIGNKVDVDEADVLAYLAREGTSNTVALYLESIIDGSRFADAVSSLLPGAMVCALMGNRTPSGLEAAATHTGAIMMQSDSVSSYLRHHGVIETADFTELVEMSKAYSVTGPSAGGSRVAVITFSGAAGVVAADLLEKSGLTLAKLSDRTIDELRAVFPDWYEPSNPVDVWSTVEQRGFADATGPITRAVLSDEAVDAVVFVPLAFDYYTVGDIEQFAEAAGSSQKPVVMWPIGDVDVVSGWVPVLERNSVPTCSSLGTAVGILRGFNIRSRSLDRRRRVTDASPSDTPIWPTPERGVNGPLFLDEVQSKRIMSLFGVDAVEEVVAHDLETALDAARSFSVPVALKLMADELAHKAGIGGVVLDVDGDQQVASVYDSLMATAVGSGLGDCRILVQ